MCTLRFPGSNDALTRGPEHASRLTECCSTCTSWPCFCWGADSLVATGGGAGQFAQCVHSLTVEVHPFAACLLGDRDTHSKACGAALLIRLFTYHLTTWRLCTSPATASQERVFNSGLLMRQMFVQRRLTAFTAHRISPVRIVLLRVMVHAT